MEYIASQENLEAFVRRAASSSVLAIDTEFLREKTYYANLCLIQLATDTVVAVVDPFAIEDLKVLAPLLSDPSIVKLFHAGGQDLEILYRELGVLPRPCSTPRWRPRFWGTPSRSATGLWCTACAA